MRRILLMLVAFMLSILTCAPQKLQAGEELTAEQIMVRVDTRPIPVDLKAQMTMNLIDKRGKARTRAVKTYRMGDDKQIMWFIEPADVKGSSFLRLSYDDRDDDMWIYLPAFGKVRRIASHARSGNFMGSDFTYEDLGNRKLKDYTYRLLKEETVGDWECWVIESIPHQGIDADYSKIVSWIWKEQFIPVKEEFYDKKCGLKKVKTLKVINLKDYWIPNYILMEDRMSEHRTELMFKNIEVDTGVEKKMFDSSFMMRIQ